MGRSTHATVLPIDAAKAAMSYIGVNIGALTVKVVAVRADATTAKVTAHQGRPLEVLQELLPAVS
jgi:hypothetical protein